MTIRGCAGRKLSASRLVAALLLATALVPVGVGAARGETAIAAGADTVGLFDPFTGSWFLRDATGHTTRLAFGRPGDVPLMGDWDGDGVDSPAVYRPQEGRLLVRGVRDQISFVYPMPAGGLPVVADTDGDGRDTVSLAQGGRLLVIDGLGRGPAALEGPDPLPILLPGGTESLVAGDFDGDGVDEVAAVHDGVVDLVGSRGRRSQGYIGAWLPVAGDWDADGVDTVGGYDSWRARFVLHDATVPDTGDAVGYGSPGMVPVAGVFGDLPGMDTPPPLRAGLPALGPGAEGREVAVLQQELARRDLYRGEIDGEFGPATAAAVVTFHKVAGVERTETWGAEDSWVMARFVLPPLPDRPDEPNRIEVDVGRQVLYLIEGGEVAEIIPVSTASGNLYYSVRSGANVRARTPHGDFTLTRHSRGWSCDWVTGWCIYNAWNFTPMYALHGYGSVPAYPASHGCVRVHTWEADFLESRLHLGMPFHVWDEYTPATRG